MKNTHCCGGVLIGLSCMALLAQPALGQDEAEQPDSPPTSQPEAMATELGSEQFETRFEYLLSKYDADGDGQISMDEYQRENGQFERLDQNSDGVISDADFARVRRHDISDAEVAEVIALAGWVALLVTTSRALGCV